MKHWDFDDWLFASALAIIAMCGLVRCTAHCAGHLAVTLAAHPAGKPRPAGLVLGQCDDGKTYEYLCAAITATDGGVTCDGKPVVRRRP